MRVISETFLREAFRSGTPRRFSVEKGQILTPSARQLLNERKVEIVTGGAAFEDPAQPPASEAGPETAPARRPRYVSAADGGLHETKPEHMTQLAGNRLVAKDHPRIVFRGKLDSLQSGILKLQYHAMSAGLPGLSADLGELLQWTREILKAEVLETALEETDILGFSAAELRERSHHPKKHFGIGHILPDAGMGGILVELNDLRTSVREVEAAGVRALRNDLEIRQPDLIRALNRMSSAVYVMMLKEQSGAYAKGA